MAGEFTNENEFVAVPFQAEISWDELKKDASGLVPCIVQDYKTGQVLMLAYMNEAAYLETAATGTMCYYSRSRKSRWLKGETSGHFQYVKSLYADCDKDTLLAKVAQKEQHVIRDRIHASLIKLQNKYKNSVGQPGAIFYFARNFAIRLYRMQKTW